MASTAEARPRYNYKVMKERYEIESRFMKIFESFTPNCKQEAVTSKFYSKCDAIDLSKCDSPRNVQLIRLVNLTKECQPKERYERPVTENQVYGWYSSEPLISVDRNSKLFFSPLRDSWISTTEVKIRADKTMARPKFAGIPFKLL